MPNGLSNPCNLVVRKLLPLPVEQILLILRPGVRHYSRVVHYRTSRAATQSSLYDEAFSSHIQYGKKKFSRRWRRTCSARAILSLSLDYLLPYVGVHRQHKLIDICLRAVKFKIACTYLASARKQKIFYFYIRRESFPSNVTEKLYDNFLQAALEARPMRSYFSVFDYKNQNLQPSIEQSY